MQTKSHILICDDDPLIHAAIKNHLKERYWIKSAYHADEALHVLKSNPIDILILDLQMRTPEEGLKYIPKFRELYPELEIIINSGISDIRSVRDGIKLGANNFVPKDIESFELILIIDKAIENQTLKRKTSQQSFEVLTHQNRHVLVGQSDWVHQLSKKIEKLKNSSAHILILGETGTGKEVIARQLRKTLADGTLEPFVAVDSSTILSSMAESVLFGHEKGAFTGAERSSKGVFEQAHGGIIYFDEIGNMPLEIQAKLLRIIQEKEVTRVGSQKVIELDFRVVCATNKDLGKMVAEGKFKDDLLQRINVIPIHTTPLRERKDDIPPLVQHFVTKLSPPKNQLRFKDSAMSALQSYQWPGNVRELSNVIAYVSTLIDSEEVEVSDLPPQLHNISQTHADRDKDQISTGTGFYERVAEAEKKILLDEYSRSDANISKMAIALKMDRSHLHSKLKEYGIHSSKTKS